MPARWLGTSSVATADTVGTAECTEITPRAITEHEVWVLEDDGKVIGFHRVILGEPAVGRHRLAPHPRPRAPSDGRPARD
jgi:hypothetical protein